ncbi:flippase [Patescibacteria group bacterium]|nr:flippase [Patescibacteria group bacterium]
MSYTRKIAHNSIIQIIGKSISTVIGVVVIGMLTRYLGTSGFGQYITIMAFLQFFGVLVDMGLYIILVKKISEPGVDQDLIVSNIFTLRLVSAVIFLGLAPLVVLFFPYPDVVKWGVLITSLSFLGITLNQVMAGVFQKHLRMDKVVIAEVVGRILLVVGTYLVIDADLGLLWVMVMVGVGSLVNFFITFLFSRRFVRIRLKFDMAIWRQVIQESWPIAVSISFNLVYFKADIIILSLFHSESVVGIYGASYKVLEVLTTFPAMFAGLVLPLLATAWIATDLERFKRVLRKAFDAMVMLAVPLVVGTLFLAQPIMDLIAPDFVDSAAILRILIFATATIFIGNLFGNTVVAINKQKTMMWLYLIVAIISLIGYLILVPKYSYFGAAGMTVASELMVTMAAMTIVGMATKVWPSLKLLFKSLLASGVMAIVLFLLTGYNIFILMLGGGVTYLVALFLFKGFSKEMIREVFRLN